MSNNAFILPFISQIKALKTLEQGFTYNPARWKGLTEAHRLLLSPYQNRLIKRNDVIKSFQEYFEGRCDILKPFLLTMVWGFGETGYGNHRTNIYISTPANIELIESAVEAVKLADFEKGFNLLKKIKFLGVSYITKVLYFASKAANHASYCLIFDIRVATNLIRLTTPNEIYQLVEVYPSSKFKNYQAYNNLIHQIALEHVLQADDVELFLFTREFNN
ncbi:MAG: hypothetical protein ACOYKR_12555 [Sphingobacterium thalpophilum]